MQQPGGMTSHLVDGIGPITVLFSEQPQTTQVPPQMEPADQSRRARLTPYYAEILCSDSRRASAL